MSPTSYQTAPPRNSILASPNLWSQTFGATSQELRIAPAKSLKTVRWVGSVREEQIRKAVFGRRRRAEKPGRTPERHADESAGTAGQKGNRRGPESSEGGQGGAGMRGGACHNERYSWRLLTDSV